MASSRFCSSLQSVPIGFHRVLQLHPHRRKSYRGRLKYSNYTKSPKRSKFTSFGRSELNFHELRDFLVLCGLMDMPVHAPTLSKRSLDSLMSCSAQVSKGSMTLPASRVRSRKNSLPYNIPGAFKCDVSFDATWHRRGHNSNQGFGVAIDVVSNKVLDHMLYQRVCSKCLKWQPERCASQSEEYTAFGLSIKPSVLLISLLLVKEWRLMPQ